jgi:hypothetical protein
LELAAASETDRLAGSSQVLFCVIGNFIVIVLAMGLVDVKFEVERCKRQSPEVLQPNVPATCWSSMDVNEYGFS